jgi:hypothetical protein
LGGEDRGMVRYGKGDSARTRKCKCTDVCAVLDRDHAKVRFRGGLLSVSAPNFNSKELHLCFVRAGAMPTRPLANTCSRRSCAAFQAIADLATVLQTGASRFSASLIRPCLAKARCCDRRQWSSQSGAGLGRAARISAQHRDSWAAALRCAKSALRYLPGTAPGTAQRCLE